MKTKYESYWSPVTVTNHTHYCWLPLTVLKTQSLVANIALTLPASASRPQSTWSPLHQVLATWLFLGVFIAVFAIWKLRSITSQCQMNAIYRSALHQSITHWTWEQYVVLQVLHHAENTDDSMLSGIALNEGKGLSSYKRHTGTDFLVLFPDGFLDLSNLNLKLGLFSL